jgi:metallophosphoesterase (TIGR00282 family)
VFQTAAGLSVAVINLEGRVFMGGLDCPFRKADELLEALGGDQKVILVDFHAEATSEKGALGAYLDGRVSAVVGTHTHVQTADERILPGGTAYLTDLGMCGSAGWVIGMETSSSIARFTSGRYSRLSVADGFPVINGLEFQVDGGSVTGLKRISANG